MDLSKQPNSRPKNNKLNLTLDLRILSAVLLVIIAAMLLLWRPWEAGVNANDRTITVTGSATVRAEPDEYVFYPMYEFKNADRQAAIVEAGKKSNEITEKLKALGAKDSQIKSSTNGGGNYRIFPAPPEDVSDEPTYTMHMTITVSSLDMAQKIQDYIVTTGPSGSVSPQPSFSDSKRKELESKARDEATKEARSKAEQSADNLGFNIGKVKSVDDGSGFGIMPAYGRDSMETADKSTSSLNVQPGENELNYSVTVTYYVR